MPLLQFKCVDCQTVDERVSAPFEETALCAQCGGLMLRVDEDLFEPYFDRPTAAPCSWCLAERHEPARPGDSHGICPRPTAQVRGMREILREIIEADLSDFVYNKSVIRDWQEQAQALLAADSEP